MEENPFEFKPNHGSLMVAADDSTVYGEIVHEDGHEGVKIMPWYNDDVAIVRTNNFVEVSNMSYVNGMLHLDEGDYFASDDSTATSFSVPFLLEGANSVVSFSISNSGTY